MRGSSSVNGLASAIVQAEGWRVEGEYAMEQRSGFFAR